MKLSWIAWVLAPTACIAAGFVFLAAKDAVHLDKGFCVETGLARWARVPVRTEEKESNSYFISPELAEKSQLIAPFLPWPLCPESRRGAHRFWALYLNNALTRLGEPNLSSMHGRDPRARVVRILTPPSFSRHPIAFRLELEDDGGRLSAAWLEDDGAAQPDHAFAHKAWFFSPLPRGSSQRALTRTEAERLWSLAHRTKPPVRRYGWEIVDGSWLWIETVDAGRRTVRHTLIDEAYNTGAKRLLCALASASDIPQQALADGDVNVCTGDARR